MSSIRDAYERRIGFYNAGDVEGMANLYTEDAARVTPSGTFEGRAAIREALSRDQAAFPDRAMTVGVIVEQGDTLAAEWTVAGTHTGPFVMPDGTELPPTGKRAELKGMELVQFRDGKVAVHSEYWDNRAVAGQLGVLPEAAA